MKIPNYVFKKLINIYIYVIKSFNFYKYFKSNNLWFDAKQSNKQIWKMEKNLALKIYESFNKIWKKLDGNTKICRDKNFSSSSLTFTKIVSKYEQAITHAILRGNKK